MRATRLILCCLPILLACGQPQYSAPAAEAQQTQARADVTEPAATSARKLVKNAVMELRADDTEATAEAVRELAASAGGFVSSLSSRREEDLVFFDITLRVPVERLEEALKSLKALAGRVDHEELQVEDVTERYVDLEARIRTLNATEIELRALLAESRSRGHDVKDIMAIYDKLTEIRSDIEQLQGKLQALGNLAALSTIRLRLSPTESARPVVTDVWRPSETARRNIRTLVGLLQSLVDLLLFCLIVLVPVAVVVGIPVWGVARFLKNRKVKTADLRLDPVKDVKDDD